MGKYKKKLRAEKAKVKLKKKKLPKGQNITDTTFKVKKIVTIEQLKKVNENEPVSSWNVPLKDLLVHLGHHSKSSRLNALNGIREIIFKYPHVLKGPLLKSTVLKMLELMVDIESKVRATAVSVLDTLFSHLDSVEILAFHEILNLHLTCAMTHRQVEMQKDSLKLADLIVKYAPEAINKNIKVVMVNFIRLLSGYKYGAQSEIFLIKGSKKDLEENRIAIFHRLKSILKICYPEHQKINCENGLVLNVNDGKNFSKSIFTRHLKKTSDLSDILKTQGSLFKKTTFDEYKEDFKVVVAQIMPLLFETWTEFCPPHSKNGFIEECILKESTAKLLDLILEIIRILYEASLKMENEDLKRLFYVNYGNQFVRLFLSSFPYVPRIMNDNKKLDFGLNENESAFAYSRCYESQNLTICYLAYHMKLKINKDLMKILDDYVLQATSIRNTKCEGILSKILEFIILVPSRHKRVDTFLEMSINAYKRTTNAEFQSKLLHILSKIITSDTKYVDLKENECVREWISYLAKGLSRNKINFEVTQTLTKVIQKKIEPNTIKEIESKFMDIIRNIANIEVQGCDPIYGKKMIANILYWCDKNVIEKAMTEGIFENTEYPYDIKVYITNIFNYKLNSRKELIDC